MAEEKKRKLVGVEDPQIETKRISIFFDSGIWNCLDRRTWSDQTYVSKW